MSKIRLKKNRMNFFLIMLVLLFLFIVLIFKYINSKVSPIIMDYASMEAEKLSNIIINKSISKHAVSNIKIDQLFTVTKENDGTIKSIDFNTSLVNRFLTETTNSIQMNLHNIENGNIDALEFSDSIFDSYDKGKLDKGVIYEVSLGVITFNPMLANVGPKIPVKISLIGDATSNISTSIKNYGINNALISIYVNIIIHEKVILPFYGDNFTIRSKVPLAMKIVTGNVPQYYANGVEQTSPSTVLPN